MSQILNRALMFNIGVFVANNNIRRSLQAFTHNYQTPDGSVDVKTKTVPAGQSFTYTPDSGTTVLLIETSAPVQANVTLGAVVTPSRPSVSYLTFIKQCQLIDDVVTSVTFTNPGTTPLQLTLVQG